MKTTITKKVGEIEALESITDIETSEQQNSLKISRNAKGDFAFESKVYHDDLKQLEADMRKQLGIASKLINEEKGIDEQKQG